jgi:transcriptional regulator with XRE-family HTH domain
MGGHGVYGSLRFSRAICEFLKITQEKCCVSQNYFYYALMSTITPAILKKWMNEKKHTQTAVAEMLGTTPGSVNRWLKNIHAIGEAEKKLLTYLIYGKLPFDVQEVDQGWHLDFTESEFAVIQLLARREGYASAEHWIVAKIRAYLAMSATPIPQITLNAGEEKPRYKKTKKSLS